MNVTVTNPNLTVVWGGALTNIGSVTSVTKNGLGNFGIDLTGIGASVPLTFNNGGAITLFLDGADGSGNPNIVPLGVVTLDTMAAPVLTIGRAGQTLLYNQAVNKIIAPTSFVSAGLANGMTLTNSNGYGLLLSDNIALTVGLANTTGSVFSVSGASFSNQTQGLTLNGQITGGNTGVNAIVLTKSGAGVLVLGNNGTGGAANSFGGSSSIIDITAGEIQAASDQALGNLTNVIRLSANSATQGFRAAGTLPPAVSSTLTLPPSVSKSLLAMP